MSKRITSEDVAKKGPPDVALPNKLNKQQKGNIAAMLKRVAKRAAAAKQQRKRAPRDVRKARRAKKEARRKNR